MNKSRVILMCFMIVFLIIGTAFAEGDVTKSLESDSIMLTDSKDGQEDEYTVVNLLISGDDVLPDVPGILYDLNGNTRTLVPISFIAKNIGAEISWNNEKKAATLTYKGDVIELTIDSKIALVNGKSVNLPNDIPAKLMTYNGSSRTMVPVAFITQHLGYEIEWIGGTRTVSINKPLQKLTGFNYSDAGKFFEIRFKTTGDVVASSYSVDGSLVGGKDSIVIDFQNTILDLSDEDIRMLDDQYLLEIYLREIELVKIAQKADEKNKVRATIDLTKKKGVEVHFDQKTNEVVVTFLNSVSWIETKEQFGFSSVVVKNAEAPTYNVSFPQGGIIVDLINSDLVYNDGQLGEIQVNKGGIKTITYSQFDPKGTYEVDDRITRIKIDLQDGIPNDYVDIVPEGDELMIYVAGDPMKGFDYVKNTKTFDRSNLDITFNIPGQYKKYYDESKNELKLVFSKDVIILSETDFDLDDSIVKEMKIIDDPGNANYEILVALSEETKYVDHTQSDRKLSFEFVNESLVSSKNRDMIIVLDAGHGGHDPGANTKRTNEKDVALAATKILKKRLESVGFRVYMTRETDVYVRLYDRASIANDLNADRFVSVHINATGGTRANGIETLYATNGNRDSKSFAKLLQQGMLDATNATNRGVVVRNDLVVTRETKMDAALVELGFVTNPAEEEKLNTESYLKAVMEGVFEGIMKSVE